MASSQSDSPAGNSERKDADGLEQLDTSRSITAGVMSLVVHSVVFLLLAAFVIPLPRPSIDSAPKKVVQVILARDLPRNAHGRDIGNHSVEPKLPKSSAGPPATENTITAPMADLFPTIDQVSRFIPAELALPVNNAIPAITGTQSVSGLVTTDQRADRIPLAADVQKFISEEQSRLRHKAPLANPVSIRLFGGQPASGRSFIFLIDHSNSMGEHSAGALQAAEEQLLIALQPLQVHMFQVIAYHHQCVFLGRRQLLPATEENKQAVRGFLHELTATGTTEHEMALRTALFHGPEVIYLLTDGGDPELKDAQIRSITKLANGRTTIHCIKFGVGPEPEEENFLKRLAAQNQGGYEYVDVLKRARAP